MTVKDIIERIRASTHDRDSLDYDDDQLIQYINNGVRFVRRTILAIDNYLLADTVTGVNDVPAPSDDEDDINTEPVEPIDLSIINIDGGFSSIIGVKVNGNELKPINPRVIDVPDQEGEPSYYYAIGLKKIALWPLPTGRVEYTVTLVPDYTILTGLDDEVPFTSDVIDFIVEYAVIRASMVNEFDVSQESQIMGAIVSQIETLFHGINGHGVRVAGYWPSGGGRLCDYGRRYR